MAKWQISSEQLAELAAAQADARREGDVSLFERCLGIGMFEQLDSAAAVAALLGKDKRTVERWLNAFDSEGVAGLRDEPRSGRPPRLCPEEKERLGKILDDIIRDGPEAHGYHGTVQSPLVAEILRREFNVALGPAQITRLLREIDFSYQRPKKALVRADKEAQATWLREVLPEALERARDHNAIFFRR